MAAKSDIPANNPWDNAGPRFEMPGVSKDFVPTTQEEARDAAIEDQLAFDQLGPLTRKAMLDSPVRWSAKRTLEFMGQMFRGMLPTSPRADATMSQMIRERNPAIIEQIRVLDEGSILKHDPRDAIKRIVDRAEKGGQRRA